MSKRNTYKEVASKVIGALQKELEKNDKVYLKHGDLGDLGNDIGIVIGEFITPDDDENEKWGWLEEDFKHGIRHGISLIDGTH